MATVRPLSDGEESSVALWPREIKVLGAQAGISSITFYTIDPAATSFDAWQADVRLRFLPIIAANPWLAAQLVSGPAMQYDASGSAEDACSRVFSATQNVAIHPNAEYNALSVACAALGVGGAKDLFKSGAPVGKLVCIDVSPTCVALLWSVSHAVADGYTYYRLINMLAENVAVEALAPQRVALKTFTADIRASLGVEEEKWVADSPVLIKNIIMGMTRDAKCRLAAYTVDPAKVAALKAAAAAESGAQPYVSTNDVITSHFFKACDARLGLMATNMRGRIACATGSMSGNYEHTPVYDAESFASPNAIRASLTAAPGRVRRVGGRPKLPQWCESCPLAMITSWDFPFKVLWPGATQTLHLPTNPMPADKIPLDIAVPFRPTPDSLAVLYFAKRATKATLTEGADSPLGELLSDTIFRGWS